MLRLISFHPAEDTLSDWLARSDEAPTVRARATTRDIPGAGHKPYPGIVESNWFADAAHAVSALGAKDLATAIAQSSGSLFVGTEKEVLGSEGARVLPGTAKVMAFIRRRPDLSVAQFQEYWGSRHAELVKDLPHLRRYVQTHLTPDNYENGRKPLFDGIAELWWPDDERFEAAWRSPEMATDNADGVNYSSGGVYIFVADETTCRCNGF